MFDETPHSFRRHPTSECIAANAWVDSYDFKQIDNDPWLLSKIGEVTERDAMHAVITSLIPIVYISKAVAWPAKKAEQI
jgi:hypothetical protein